MGAASGMTMVALMPNMAAAYATPCAWFPAEDATTAQRSPRSIMEAILLLAPRSLNAPVFCRFSHLRYISPPVMRENVVEWSNSVRCTIPFMRPAAFSKSLSGIFISFLHISPRRQRPRPFCSVTTKSCTFVTMPRAVRLPLSASLFIVNSETSTQ